MRMLDPINVVGRSFGIPDASLAMLRSDEPDMDVLFALHLQSSARQYCDTDGFMVDGISALLNDREGIRGIRTSLRQYAQADSRYSKAPPYAAAGQGHTD
jgi:hypothetical protein